MGRIGHFSTTSAEVATTHTVGDFTCLTYRIQGTSVNVTNNANVTASLSPLLETPVSATGTLATASSNDHAEGAQQPPCFL